MNVRLHSYRYAHLHLIKFCFVMAIAWVHLSAQAQAVKPPDDPPIGSTLPPQFLDETQELRRLMDAGLTPQQIILEQNRHRQVFARQIPELIARLTRTMARFRDTPQAETRLPLLAMSQREAIDHLQHHQVSYQWFIPFVLRLVVLTSNRDFEIPQQSLSQMGRNWTQFDVYRDNNRFLAGLDARLQVADSHPLEDCRLAVRLWRAFPTYVLLPALTQQIVTIDESGVQQRQDLLPSARDLVHTERMNMTIFSVPEFSVVFEGNHDNGRPQLEADAAAVVGHDAVHGIENASDDFREIAFLERREWSPTDRNSYRRFQDHLIKTIEGLPVPTRRRALIAYLVSYRELGVNLWPPVFHNSDLIDFLETRVTTPSDQVVWITDRFVNKYDLGAFMPSELIPAASLPEQNESPESQSMRFWEQSVADLASAIPLAASEFQQCSDIFFRP